jgi:hypothetical protein
VTALSPAERAMVDRASAEAVDRVRELLGLREVGARATATSIA